MASTKYSYSISADFPGTVETDKLVTEIAASSIATSLDRIDTDGNTIDIWFSAALSAGDKTTLDNDATGPSGGLIAAHGGASTVTDFVTSAQIVGLEVSVTEDATWQLIGSVVTNPAGFIDTMSEVVGRVVGCYKTDSTGSQFQIRAIEGDG